VETFAQGQPNTASDVKSRKSAVCRRMETGIFIESPEIQAKKWMNNPTKPAQSNKETTIISLSAAPAGTRRSTPRRTPKRECPTTLSNSGNTTSADRSSFKKHSKL